jgi:hypothetical protein
MRTPTIMAAASIALSLPTILSPLSAHAEPACESEAMPKGLWGICETPLFKAYVACIERNIPVWGPEGKMKSAHLPPRSSVLAVLAECEDIAKKFGKKYGNGLADILKSVANNRISTQYGIAPLAASPSTTITPNAAPPASADNPDRPEKVIFDLLKPGKTGPQVKKICALQLDGANVSCDIAWYIEFKDGGYSIQFNKGTEAKPVVAFFGTLANPDTITLDAVQVRIGDRSSSMDEYKATGQCLLGATVAQCQAHLSDGRLFVGSITPLAKLEVQKRTLPG